MNSEEYSFIYFDNKYIEKIESIVERAKKITKRSKYFNKNLDLYDFNFWNKKAFLEQKKFNKKSLFKEVNFAFSYYCWFVNICLYEEYGDDFEEFKIDCYLRSEIEELCEKLSDNELFYIKKELFYLDLVYCILTDTKVKIKSTQIDNPEYNYEEVKDKKEQLWHELYYPVNLNIPIKKEFL